MASATVGTLRAVLSADTGEFTRAMSAASANVRDLADKLRADLEPRQRAVNAAVRDFLGGPEIRRAQEYVTAVQQIGGATALVEADQRKVNRALAEALQHYSKLGEQAPQAMIDLEAATRTVDVPMRAAQGSADRLWSSLRNIAGTIGIAFSAGAIIGFARSVFTAASDIKDMASALGWSAEALQRFKFAAEQSGGSFEALQRAASKLNQDLAEGDKSTVAALQAAGLSFATIRAMSPEAAFAAVADAVGRIEDPMIRANVAQELFGKGALTLLPGMVEGYTKLGESATVMSNTTIERLEAAQDQWDRFKTTIIIYSGEILGEILDTWTVRVPQIWTIVTTGLSNVVATFLAFATDVVSYVQATYQDVKTWLHDRFVLYVVTPIGVALDRIRTFFSAAGLYIVRTVQDLYSGVKMWLVDKFTAIVDGIKGKTDAVTGFFADMYDKVVGRSYVPEMVALIDQHFGRLGAVMVTPTGQATQGVVGHFQRLSTEIGMELGNLINHFAGPGGFGEKMTTFASDFARGFTSTVLNTLVPGLGTVVNAAWSIIEQGLVRIWNGLVAFWNKVKGIFNFFGSAPRDSPQDAVGDFNPNDPNNPFYGREDPGNPTPYVPLPEGGSSGDLYVPGEGLTPYEEYLRQREAVYGFARGTRGRFMNFGSAFRTTLHGTEAVVPQAAVPSLAEQLAAALATWQPIGSYGAALSPVMASGGVRAPGPMAMIAKVYLDGRQIAEASTRYQGEAAARYRMWR